LTSHKLTAETSKVDNVKENQQSFIGVHLATADSCNLTDKPNFTPTKRKVQPDIVSSAFICYLQEHVGYYSACTGISHNSNIL